MKKGSVGRYIYRMGVLLLLGYIFVQLFDGDVLLVGIICVCASLGSAVALIGEIWE